MARQSTSYSDLLKDPRWQKVRLEKLQAADWMCERCYDSETMLSVHHKRYIKGRKPWEYDHAELAVLCQPCHEIEHEDKEVRTAILARMHVDGPGCEGDCFAIAFGAIPSHMTSPETDELLAKIASDNPYHFLLGRLIRALDDRYRFTAESLAHAVAEMDRESEFAAELGALLEKHGVHADA